MQLFYLSGLLIGLFGSLHCIGMCGPIALALPGRPNDGASFYFSRFIYQFGRITTYAGIGLLFGFFGEGLRIAGLQQGISITAGVLIIVLYFAPKLIPALRGSGPGWYNQLLSPVKKAMSRLYSNRKPAASYLMGLLNGLLPCGLVYMAVVGSIAAPDPIQAMGFMAAFGFGTIPAMLALSIAGPMVPMSFRVKARKAIPYLVVIIGLMFILRGLDLGIPYLSPAMDPGAVCE